MNYVVVGLDAAVVKAQVNKIEKQLQHESTTQTSTFDWIENSLSDILTCLVSSNLFVEHSIVVVNNFDYLVTNKSKSAINQNYKDLIDYLMNPNPQSTLILVNIGPTKLLKNQNVSKILAQSEVFRLEPWTSGTFEKWIKSYCRKRGQTIKNDAVDLIMERLPHNLYVIKNEINKLLLLQEPITTNIVKDNTPIYFESNVFDLVNDLMQKRADAFLHKFSYLIDQGFEWGQLLGALSSNLAQIRNLKIAANHHMNIKQAALKCKINEFRVRKLWPYINLWSFNTIQNLIITIANLDFDFKNNKVYDKIIINWYVLKLLFQA